MKIPKGKKRLNYFDKFILILNIFAALAIVISYLAPITNPRNFHLVALLGFCYQVLLLFNFIFIVYWVIRIRIYAFISLFSILSGFGILLLNYRFGFAKPANSVKQPSGIRIMAYNVRGFYGIDSLSERPIQTNVSQLVDKMQPDIVTFEEYVYNRLNTDTTANALKKILKTNYYYGKSFGVFAKEGSNFLTGNIIFSKYPIVDTGYVVAPLVLKLRAIYVDVKADKGIFRVYCVHLAAVEIREEEKDQYLNGNLSINSLFFIMNRLTSAFLIRSRQVDFIKKHISQCPYPYMIVGDFNDTPNSFAVNELGDGLKNAFIEKGSGLVSTYYNKFPKLQIDHILVSPQFDVMSYQAIDKELSDHKPVVSDLKLN